MYIYRFRLVLVMCEKKRNRCTLMLGSPLRKGLKLFFPPNFDRSPCEWHRSLGWLQMGAGGNGRGIVRAAHF